jgi:hypothetical protein
MANTRVLILIVNKASAAVVASEQTALACQPLYLTPITSVARCAQALAVRVAAATVQAHARVFARVENSYLAPLALEQAPVALARRSVRGRVVDAHTAVLAHQFAM